MPGKIEDTHVSIIPSFIFLLYSLTHQSSSIRCAKKCIVVPSTRQRAPSISAIVQTIHIILRNLLKAPSTLMMSHILTTSKITMPNPAGTTRSMQNNRKLRLGVVIYHRPCSKIIGNGRFLLKKWDKFSLYFMLYAISILLYLLTNVLTIFYFYCTNNKIELAYNIPYLVMLFGVSMLSFNAELKSNIKSIPVQSSGCPSSSETFEQTARIFLYLQTFSSFSITFKDHLSRLLKFF